MARSLSPSPERAKERSRKRERSHSPRDHKKEKKSRKSHKRSRSPREDRSRARYVRPHLYRVIFAWPRPWKTTDCTERILELSCLLKVQGLILTSSNRCILFGSQIWRGKLWTAPHLPAYCNAIQIHARLAQRYSMFLCEASHHVQDWQIATERQSIFRTNEIYLRVFVLYDCCIKLGWTKFLLILSYTPKLFPDLLWRKAKVVPF